MENRSLMLSLLRKGQTGEEILKILDTIIGSDDTAEDGTLDPIDF